MSPAPTRNDAIDRLRGAVMVLMALDHARDFFGDFSRSPTNLATTTPALFATRWITHFCAPVFVFLAGTAAFLSGARKTKGELSRFLATRGLWLVFLELTVVRFGWFFDPFFSFSLFQVIWAIGCSMIVLAALVHLRPALIAGIGGSMIAFHNLLDTATAASVHVPSWLFAVLHKPARFEIAKGHVLFIAYPLVPWIGVMALGYAFGVWMQRPSEERRRLVLRLGIALSLAFVLIRGINRYGDPHPWQRQRDLGFTIASFLNCEKYPPSLLYLLMTLGPALVALALMDSDEKEPSRSPLSVFGKAPLFYYVAHIYLLHLLAVAVGFALHGKEALTFAFYMRGGLRMSLTRVYLIWIFVVVVLYAPSRWFAQLKARRRDLWVLGYL